MGNQYVFKKFVGEKVLDNVIIFRGLFLEI